MLYNVNDIFIERKPSYGNGFEEYIFRSIPSSVVVFDNNGNLTSIPDILFTAAAAISASYSNISSTSISASYSEKSTNSDISISASYLIGYVPPILVTSSISSSYANTASYALNGGGSSLTTGSTYPITASYSNFSNTASAVILGSGVTNQPYYIDFFSSYTGPQLGYASNGLTFNPVINQLSGSGLNITASLYGSSSYSTTASYALNGGGVSTTASYALTASSFSSISGSNLLYLQCSDGNTYPVTLFNEYGNIILEIGQTPVTGTNNFLNIGNVNVSNSSSYATTASYALNGGGSGTNIITGSTLPITSSWSLYNNSSSYANTSSYMSFNGNRSITRSGYSGVNVGGNDVDDFLNNFFFPFVSSTVSVSGGGLYETGSVQTVSVFSNITVNNETLFGTASVFKDSVLWNTDNTIPPYTFTFNDSNVTSNHSYETFVQTNNNGSPTIINSNTTSISFVYPYLYGMSTISGLSGSALYNAFTPQIINKSNQNINLNGSAVYIYFAYPSTYPNLTSILDPNSFQIIGSFNVSTALVTSTGLTNNWSVPYTIYQTQLVASPAGTFQFIY